MHDIRFRAWNERLKKMEQDIGHSLEYHLQHYPVMQYTGLKDKNGVEIYEGDIVKCQELTAKVFWDDEMVGFYCEAIGGGCVTFAFTDWEVISNIHENKEVLNETE